VSSIEQRLVILAPPALQVPACFRRVTADNSEREGLLAAVQKLRGAVYLSDGAVHASQLTADGRHVTPEDARAWHIVMRTLTGEITACSWYLEHGRSSSLQDIRVRNVAQHRPIGWMDRVGAAVTREMTIARVSKIPYAEAGGWAVAPGHRGPGEAMVPVFAMFSLSQALGGAIGLTMATMRHSSASILRRLGMAPLASGGEEIPSYFDPHYQCEMELLRFDTRNPGSKYAGVVSQLTQRLQDVPVFGDCVVSQMESQRLLAA